MITHDPRRGWLRNVGCGIEVWRRCQPRLVSWNTRRTRKKSRDVQLRPITPQGAQDRRMIPQQAVRPGKRAMRPCRHFGLLSTAIQNLCL